MWRLTNHNDQCGNYNSYTPEQWARIGKYASENGATRAAKHYTAVWGISINESTARILKSEPHLIKLKQEISERKDQQGEDTTKHLTGGGSICLVYVKTTY